jgi:outer membrane receptor for ferric coprogen and ferric-rhodotorulic acid
MALFYVFGFPDPDTGEGLDPFAYRSNGKIISKALDFHFSGPVNWLGREHELVAGFTGSRTRNTGDEFGVVGELAPVGNFFEWDGSYPEPEFDEGYLLNDIDSRQNGVYIAGRFSLADPLKLVAGARFATWKTDHFYLYDSPDITFSTDYRKVIPYAGLVYDVSTNYSVFASFTGIFKPQVARNVDLEYLDPVDGRSFEVGIKGEHADGRLNTSLTLFDTRQDNVAAPAVDPETGEFVDPLPDGTQPSMAIDGTRTRGFELEAAGQLNDQWSLNVGWTRYQIEDADGAAIRTYTPGTLIRSFATWSLNDRFSLGGGVNWQSDTHTLVGSPVDGTVLRQSDVLLLSLMGRWQVNDSLSLQLNGQNLLDEKYFVLDEYDNTYYGPPASVFASIDWSF